MRFYKTPFITRWLYPSLIWKKSSNDSIYLTFDDGPNPEVTPWVLEELNKVGAKATFFCLGRNAKNNESLVEEIKKNGHLIANHTFSHLKGWKSNDAEYLKDVKKCDEVLSAFGIENNFFRPPFGRIKRSQVSALKNKRIIMWSHLAWDFDQNLDYQKSLKALKRAKPGSILTFHDNEKAFENLKKILPELLNHFKSKGFRIETLEHD